MTPDIPAYGAEALEHLVKTAYGCVIEALQCNPGDETYGNLMVAKRVLGRIWMNQGYEYSETVDDE